MTTTAASPTDHAPDPHGPDEIPARWHHAHVAWFNPEKGFGFLTPEHGPAVFVDFSVIEAPGYKTLTAGQPVIYTAHNAPRGPEATRVIPYLRGTTTPAPDTPTRGAALRRLVCRAGRRAT
ncbi:cold-shock protein [Nocardia sp. NPDC055321]